MARALPENKFFGMVTLLMSKQDEWKKAEDPLQSLYRYGQLAGISANDFNGLMQNRNLLLKDTFEGTDEVFLLQLVHYSLLVHFLEL